MNSMTIEYYSVKAPRVGSIAAIAVTNTTAGTDLSAANQLSALATRGKFVTLISDADVYFFFNTSNAGTVDETNTTAGNATRAWLLPAKTPLRVSLNGGYTWFMAKTATTATVRAYVSSFDGEGN